MTTWQPSSAKSGSQEQGYDLASACRESCLAADALAEDEKNDPDGRDDR